MEDKRVTLKDISKKLNVSLSTVHKALYDKKGISETTRAKILKTAEEMNFKINIVASTLKRKSIKIAVILPNIFNTKNHFYGDIYSGINDARQSLSDFNIEIINVNFNDYNYKSQKQALEAAFEKYSKSIDGLLTIPWNSPELDSIINKFSDCGIPVVNISSETSSIKSIKCIAPPPYKIGMMAGELISKMINTPGKVIIISSNKEANIDAKIIEGFINTVSTETPFIDIIQLVNNNSENTKKTLNSFFNNFHDINGIYSTDAENTLIVGNLLDKLNSNNKFKFIGSELFDESIKFLKNNILDAIIYENPYKQAYNGINFLFNYIIKNTTDIPADFNKISIIFKNNLDFYIN